MITEGYEEKRSEARAGLGTQSQAVGPKQKLLVSLTMQTNYCITAAHDTARARAHGRVPCVPVWIKGVLACRVPPRTSLVDAQPEARARA
jgi:hypothetical protein